MLSKEILCRIPNVYTTKAFRSGTKLYVGAGSETDPVVEIHDLASREKKSLADCPGGVMSFIPVPGRDGECVSVMGLFPPFIGGEAGLYHHIFRQGSWHTEKFLDLPFAHRCEFLPDSAEPVLIAATVSRQKDSPEDWSRPGELVALRIHAGEPGGWEREDIAALLTRNHGMLRNSFRGREHLFVSGAEGVFSIQQNIQGNIEVVSVFNHEVSEMCFVDLNDDGKEELVTIEPFHGNSLNIYRQQGSGWTRIFQDALSFGHGLSGGFFNGRPLVVAGNRREEMSLVAYLPDESAASGFRKFCLEEGVGPTQTQVFSHGGIDYILSANQKKNEVALYSGSLGI